LRLGCAALSRSAAIRKSKLKTSLEIRRILNPADDAESAGRPFKPGPYVIVVALLVATTLLASWRPARRAMTVDPAELLRDE
jgi:hypothetical protein